MKLVQRLRRKWTIWQPVHAVGIAAGEVLLTFDDGPDPEVTGRLLDVLAKRKVSAAFCVCGASIRIAPELIRRMADGGHLIVNHGDFHRPLAVLAEKALQKEIAGCEAEIRLALASRDFRTEFFRPACGLWTPVVEKTLVRLNKRVMPITHFGWDTNLTEATYRNWITLTRQAARRDHGGIFVLHDRRLTSWKASNDNSYDRQPNVCRTWVPAAVAELIDQLRSDSFAILDPHVWKERARISSDLLSG